MDLKMDAKDIIVLTLIFIAALWLWTLPIQENPMPFGEADAAYHFGVSDYMSYNDKSMGIKGLPDYIAYKYYMQNKVLGKNALNNVPTYNLDFSFMQILVGDRIIAPYILIAITSFLVCFSMYFLVRKLFGFVPAVLVSTALIFSIKDILTYLWGQRPNLSSFIFVPLLMYSMYKYVNSKRPIYLYISALLFCSAYLFHLAGGMLAIAVIVPFLILVAIKEKKIPFDKSSFRHVLICLIIFIALCGPFTMVYFGRGETDVNLGINNPKRLLSWFKVPEDNLGLNPVYYEYSNSYIGSWTGILVLAGLFFLLFKRNRKNLLILGAFIGLYFLLHLDVFGITPLSYRIARFLPFEVPLFYLLMVLGLLSVISIVKMKKIKLLVCAVFLVTIIAIQGPQAYNYLSNAYDGILRITPQQYDASIWLLKNTPEDSMILNIGTITYPKQKFIQFLSQRYGIWMYEDKSLTIDNAFDSVNKRIIERGGTEVLKPTHVLLDYSDWSYLPTNVNYENEMNYLRWQENELINRNATKVYDVENIRVYELR